MAVSSERHKAAPVANSAFQQSRDEARLQILLTRLPNFDNECSPHHSDIHSISDWSFCNLRKYSRMKQQTLTNQSSWKAFLVASVVAPDRMRSYEVELELGYDEMPLFLKDYDPPSEQQRSILCCCAC
jgi:hypothetical protein